MIWYDHFVWCNANGICFCRFTREACLKPRLSKKNKSAISANRFSRSSVVNGGLIVILLSNRFTKKFFFVYLRTFENFSVFLREDLMFHLHNSNYTKSITTRSNCKEIIDSDKREKKVFWVDSLLLVCFCRDETLESHVKFLETLGIAGVSHHSLLFSKTAPIQPIQQDEVEEIRWNFSFLLFIKQSRLSSSAHPDYDYFVNIWCKKGE